MHVEVHDPRNKPVLSRAYGSQGRVSYLCYEISKLIINIYNRNNFQFTFTSHTPGEHKICLMANSTNWSWNGGKLRVHLDLQVKFNFLKIMIATIFYIKNNLKWNFKIGEDREGYREIADREKLTELQLRVRQLLDQVQQIQKEQNFQRFREERFRHTSESTNAKVFWWATIQVL